MSKKFMEVIPDLQVGDDLREILNLVEVEKVVLSKDRTTLRIYILSQRLIPKKNIYVLFLENLRIKLVLSTYQLQEKKIALLKDV